MSFAVVEHPRTLTLQGAISMNIYSEFLQENYCKYTIWYLNIVNNAKIRANGRKKAISILGYVEAHHIFPKCLDKFSIGVSDSQNLVYLSAREHFICHILLCKIFPKNIKLKFAVSCFLRDKTGNRKLSSRQFEIARKLHAQAVSENNKGKIPWNIGVPRTELEKNNISNSLKGNIPWNKNSNPNKKIRMTKIEANALSSTRMKQNNPMNNENSVEKVREAAKLRSKSICCCQCQKLFDPGNFSQHRRRCPQSGESHQSLSRWPSYACQDS